MTLRSGLLIIILGFGLASCGGHRRPEPIAPAPAQWRKMVTLQDRNRLGEWRVAFVQALDKARKAGNAGSVAREGALLDPDAALPDPAPSAGFYRCRAIKMGGKSASMGDYVVYPATPCVISDEGEVLALSVSKGSQRPVGLIFPAEGSRMIFLGTMVLGDERRALEYGRDSGRDMAGAFERVGPKRWRLILPRPRFESMMDVIELTPA
jgi:Domain of unknown function (DUF4893)